ncbi:MAG TPA: signal peptidase II [Thermodesulfovibrionales bacterium]|jgi:signal peptidase II|nr:signal peptidase II [Thermodesulfovibrionales bacterium]
MKKAAYLLVALAIVLFDQITKHIARDSIGPFEIKKILPFLQLVSVRNEGAAFGLFAALGNTTFILISVVAIIVVLVLLMRTGEDRFGLALVLGGAIGNLIDRIVFGKVTDFIDVFAGRFHWPAFNVADSSLTVGLVVLLFHSFFPGKRENPL